MAEIYGTRPVADHDPDEQAGMGGNLKAATNLMGAAVSLALLVGVGVWGYKLLMRDVSGIPVVRAIEGPMRVQPENPGGDDADHQGLAVNAVAAVGTAEAPPDRLVLAPRPVELAEEDQPVAQLIRPVARAGDAGTAAPAAAAPSDEPQPPLAVEEPEAIAAASLESRIEPGIEPGAETDMTQSAIDAIVAQLAGAVRPVASGTEVVMTASAPIVAPAPLVLAAPQAGTPGDGTSDQAAGADPETPIPAVARDVPGVALSLRPQMRPAGLVAAASGAALTRASAPATQPVEVDPGAVPVGTRVVQLGAFDTPDMARTEWDRLNGRFGDYLQGKQRVVQEASSGGRTFWRLRAMGFDDLNDARRFCSVLVSEGADCIPVVTR